MSGQKDSRRPGLIDRRRLLKAAAAGGAALAIGAVGVRSALRRARNLIVIVSDALRADHLGMARNGVTLMPTVEGLAERGTNFTNCIAPSSWTLLSVPAYLSSTAPLPNATTIDGKTAFFPDSAVSIAEVLSPGAFTSAVIKNPWLYQGPELAGRDRRLFARGFESYHVPMPEVADNPLYEYFGGFKKYYPYEDAVRATNQALNVLEMRRLSGDDRPFFLYLHYMDTHEPYYPPEEFRRRFVPEKPLPGIPDANLTGVIRRLSMDRGEDAVLESDIPILERSKHIYAAAANYVDSQIGRLFEYLKAHRLFDSSTIVFTSDHGEEFAERGWIGHVRTLYREVLEVPLVISGPGMDRGRTVEETVALVDLVPTLTEMLRIEGTGAVFEGECTLPGKGGSRDIVSTTRFPPGTPVPKYIATCITTRTGGKYIRTAHLDAAGAVREVSEEVYDLRKDPGEKVNLSESMGEFADAKSNRISDMLTRRSGRAGMTTEAPEGLEDAIRSLGYMN
jgi:arylsulfatase